MEPTPLSASPLTVSQEHTAQNLPAPNALYLPLLLLDAISILEREEAVEVPYGYDTLDSGVCDERGGEVEC